MKRKYRKIEAGYYISEGSLITIERFAADHWRIRIAGKLFDHGTSFSNAKHKVNKFDDSFKSRGK